MPIELNDSNDGRVLEVHARGTLSGDDYRTLLPAFEQRLKHHDKVNVLFEMVDFHGWDAKGFWSDLKFDLKHFTDVGRFAMVGDKAWEKNLTDLSRPFTMAEVRYFDRSHLDEARAWVAAA